MYTLEQLGIIVHYKLIKYYKISEKNNYQQK